MSIRRVALSLIFLLVWGLGPIGADEPGPARVTSSVTGQIDANGKLVFELVVTVHGPSAKTILRTLQRVGSLDNVRLSAQKQMGWYMPRVRLTNMSLVQSEKPLTYAGYSAQGSWTAGEVNRRQSVVMPIPGILFAQTPQKVTAEGLVSSVLGDTTRLVKKGVRSVQIEENVEIFVDPSLAVDVRDGTLTDGSPGTLESSFVFEDLTLKASRKLVLQIAPSEGDDDALSLLDEALAIDMGKTVVLRSAQSPPTKRSHMPAVESDTTSLVQRFDMDESGLEGLDPVMRASLLEALRQDQAEGHNITNPGVGIARASMLESTGDFEGAERVYVKTLEKYPRSADGWFQLGKVRQQLARQDEAILAYRKYLELKPNDTEVPAHLAWALVRTKRHDEAIEIVDGLLKKDPKNFPAHQVMLGTLAEQEKWPELVDAAHRALKAEPNEPSFHYRLGVALQRTGADGDLVRTSLLRALELEPEDWTRAAVARELADKKIDIDRAEVVIRELIDQSAARVTAVRPKTVTASYPVQARELAYQLGTLGLVLSRRNKLDTALSFYEASFALWPTSGAAESVSKALAKSGNLDEAAAWYRYAVENTEDGDDNPEPIDELQGFDLESPAADARFADIATRHTITVPDSCPAPERNRQDETVDVAVLSASDGSITDMAITTGNSPLNSAAVRCVSQIKRLLPLTWPGHDGSLTRIVRLRFATDGTVTATWHVSKPD